MTNEDYKKIEDLKIEIQTNGNKIQNLDRILIERNTRLIIEGDEFLNDRKVNQRFVIDDDEARPFIIYMKAKYMLELDRLNKIFAEIKITI